MNGIEILSAVDFAIFAAGFVSRFFVPTAIISGMDLLYSIGSRYQYRAASISAEKNMQTAV